MKKIVVVGGGTMGLDIAHTFARSGHAVVVREISDELAEKSHSRLVAALDKLVARGKMDEAKRAEILGNMTFTTDLAAAADADLVLEAIVENLDVKKSLFQELDGICKADTIFATNTSSISITAIAAATQRADRFIGMHFFNPATVMKLVEVIRGVHTSQETYDAIWPKFAPLKGMKMREITTETVQPLVDAEISKGRSRSQQEKIRSMYSLLCQIAMEKDIIDRNYATFLRLSTQGTVVRDVFREGEIKAILEDAATCETSKIIAILLYTGFRINELLQMPLARVNIGAWYFVGGEKTEAGIDRIVPIVATIRPFVRYFYERADGNLFLSGYMGNQSAGNFRRRDYYPTLERLGIRTPERTMRPHSCRYTLATRGHSLGIDNDTLVKILGHADFDTTSAYYIQADLDKLHSEMSKIDDLSAKRPRSDQTRKTGKREKP